MLLHLREYHRPGDDGGRRGLDRALELLARPDIRTVPLAGGDALVGAADPTVNAVVDLQGLGLDVISVASDAAAIHIGAMVTRAALAEAEPARTRYGGVVAEGARRWGGSIQRNRATVGGAVATAAGDDPLIAALLICDAAVVLYDRAGFHELPLVDFLANRVELLAAPALITELVAPAPVVETGAALASVARTPTDAPIVLAAAAVMVANGGCGAARLALGGVAESPVRLPEVEAWLVGQPLTEETLQTAGNMAADLVCPAGDFRGSAEYRRALAGVLATRALRQALTN